MAITDNPYLEESFYRHLHNKTASAYVERGLSAGMASAAARRDIEKLAALPNPQAASTFSKFLKNIGGAFKSTADDIAGGSTKIVTNSAQEASAVTNSAAKGVGEATKEVAGKTQAMPKFQAADGATLDFGDKMRLHGANLMNAAGNNPGIALAGATGAVGATGLATGAMLS